MKGPILFLGIGGSGMSSLAHMAIDLKLPVIGYDKKNSETTDYLKERGVTLFHSIEDIPLEGIEMVVYSSAMGDKYKEVFERIKSLNIPLKHRSEFMHLLVSNQKSISVAGSHGKTSTTTMVSQILTEVGLNPTIMIGGDTSLLEKRGGKIGKGEYAVYESDESDGTFLGHKANIRLLTNIDNDHLDYYHTRQKLEKAFLDYMGFSVPGETVLFLGDEGIRSALEHHHKELLFHKEFHLNLILNKDHSKIDWFLYLKTKFDQQITTIVYEILNDTISFEYENQIYHLQLPFPGVHYLTNGLVALVCALKIGIKPQTSIEILSRYIGVKRRQEVLGVWKNISVIDDYGHHPTEIKMVIQSLKNKLNGEGKLQVIFQPHRYTRTSLLLEELATSLLGADVLYLLPIYSAGETPIEGISSMSFLPYLDSKKTTMLSGNVDEDLEAIKPQLQACDLLLCLGAGNVRDWGSKLVS
ncbi:UDP-N-acetylmuramate--L-alanine ligase [Leptospira bouyouniensis]|uniref:UDP-N-acetylmuramate--L-alanine ligase n=1 Tax=Leptospira bouyouniensis TaxID=2484911 RepID=UPI0010910407|nr:UDP-N-acetylmuramate--L-alanine ligase [Leptospira bouyouniensis]TGM80714.1 UDP-N-acetylmuramate--L-alanine ligase [Leptospira bouyouniensis]